MESWYERSGNGYEDDDGSGAPLRYWLEFQVCSDGLEPDDANTAAVAAATAAGAAAETPPPPPPPPPLFTRFGDLPTELRLRVWELAVRPRIVMLACVSSRSATHERAQLALRPRRPFVPVLLHVCRESRAVALRHWTPAFAWRISSRLCSDGSASSRPGAAFATAAAARQHAEQAPEQPEPRVWFNFAADALLLAGELEPFDRYGFNSPMVYFLRREDAARVRHVAVAFEALRYGACPDEHLFGCVFHIVDRFACANRLLITCTPRDERTYGSVLVPPVAAGVGAGLPGDGDGAAAGSGNIIQKIWSGWLSGRSVVTLALACTQILMVREDGLASFIESHS